MKNTLIRLWTAFLALFSVISIVEGGSVLIKGGAPDQVVLPWLVVYNVTMATLSLAVLFLVWTDWPRAGTLVLTMLLGHILVLAILSGIHFTGGPVATQSIGAMGLRVLFWGIMAVIALSKAGKAGQLAKDRVH